MAAVQHQQWNTTLSGFCFPKKKDRSLGGFWYNVRILKSGSKNIWNKLQLVWIFLEQWNNDKKFMTSTIFKQNNSEPISDYNREDKPRQAS